ncbi:MAG: hypothetical protein IJO37_02385 [Ruminiclostridium sp.]|nr:hypothetical protein [Ruminiclostridium sp.]
MRDRVELTGKEFADRKSLFRAALEIYGRDPDGAKAFAAIAGTVGLCRISEVMLLRWACSLLGEKK